MFLNLEKTLRMRFRVRWVVRVFGLLILTWVAYSVIDSLWNPVVNIAIEATTTPPSGAPNPNSFSSRYPSSENSDRAILRSMTSILRRVPEIALAALLLRFNRQFARWCIPLPLWKCPKCEHDVTDPASNRCNECGLLFALESPSAPVSSDAGLGDLIPPTSSGTV